jgi:hypothetical protein
MFGKVTSKDATELPPPASLEDQERTEPPLYSEDTAVPGTGHEVAGTIRSGCFLTVGIGT